MEAESFFIEPQRKNQSELIPANSARILVAEDNPVNQMVIKKLLGRMGFGNIDIAENGEQAVIQTSMFEYDAVIMDCQMPVMDGFEATIEIRRKETSSERHLLIIALTANAVAGDKEKCFAAGMDEYLAKPVDPERLRQTLGQWFLV